MRLVIFRGKLTEWSVRPDEFGEFLVAIFDHWIKRDVGKIFVMNIEWAFANFVRCAGCGLPSSANLWALGDC